jgi:hypothetical protein
MATNLIYEGRLDGASNYMQWKMRSVENKKLWRITVTIARSVLLTWGSQFRAGDIRCYGIREGSQSKAAKGTCRNLGDKNGIQ